jgi:prepilin-type N-terminal cleavage/methylation domain-containing protein
MILMRRKQTCGFTLLELAVVVLVISLILGSLLVPLNTQVQQRNVAETQRILEETRQALVGYAMVNGYLPQPAKSATDGREQDIAAQQCAPVTPANCTGFIPWVALGTPRADAWGKLIRYSVNPNYTSTIPASQFTSTAGQRIVRTRDASGAGVDLATNLPAVVLSHGASNYGTTIDGTALPDGPNANDDEDVNATAGTAVFWSRTATNNPAATGGEFDDILAWIPPGQLFTQLVAAGKLP